LAIVENYPDLKGNEVVGQLQHRLTGLENEIAFCRQSYNDTLERYNSRIGTLPDLLIAKPFGFQHADFLQYEAGYGRSLVLTSEVAPLRRVRWTCREAVNLLFFSVKAAIGPREMSVRIELLRERARSRGKLAQLLGF
jgi:hypothetical protein